MASGKNRTNKPAASKEQTGVDTSKDETIQTTPGADAGAVPPVTDAPAAQDETTTTADTTEGAGTTQDAAGADAEAGETATEKDGGEAPEVTTGEAKADEKAPEGEAQDESDVAPTGDADELAGIDAGNLQIDDAAPATQDTTVDAQADAPAAAAQEELKAPEAPAGSPVTVVPVHQTAPGNIAVLQEAPPVVVEEPAVHPYLTDIEGKLNAYIDAMKPGRLVDDKTGPFHQKHLLNTYIQVLSAPATISRAAIDILMTKVLEHRGNVFNERQIYLYLTNSKMSAAEQNMFHRLTNLFLMTAEPSTRGLALKEVDLRKVLETLPDDRRRRALGDYFTPTA